MMIEIDNHVTIGRIMRDDRMADKIYNCCYIEYDFSEGNITLYDHDHNGLGMYNITEKRMKRLEEILNSTQS